MEFDHKPLTLLIEVSHVFDGDTVAVRSSDLTVEWLPGGTVQWNGTVRLYGIDSPETIQRDGAEARKHLLFLTLHKTFTLEVVAPNDRYNRILGLLYKSDRQDSINRAMVLAGWAYSYRSDETEVGVLKAEEEAQRLGMGVWRHAELDVRPWEFRGFSESEQRRREREWRFGKDSVGTDRTKSEGHWYSSRNDDMSWWQLIVALIGLVIGISLVIGWLFGPMIYYLIKN